MEKIAGGKGKHRGYRLGSFIFYAMFAHPLSNLHVRFTHWLQLSCTVEIKQNIYKIIQIISRTTEPILGLFVLI